ncbi:MAG: hypothetical protein HUJ88_11065 [Fusobacterium necrophorum]|nr:hypothetical protein [Fusobacterium necrophorum]
MVIQLGKFYFDLDRFNQVVLGGREFKTKIYSTEVLCREGFYTVKQTKQYKLNEEFVIRNLDILLDLRIVKKR